jgi:hypothetical protein
VAWVSGVGQHYQQAQPVLAEDGKMVKGGVNR